MKTVIHIWTNNCYNIKYNPDDTSSYWGLGDLIRGTIKLYQLQQYLKFNLVVDISLHPISRFIENTNHKYTKIIEANKNKIPYYYINNLKPYLKNELKSNNINNIKTYPEFNNEKIILLTTNDKNIESLNISEQCKLFIKNILKPKIEFQHYFDNILLDKLGKLKNEYNVFHIRLGDDYLIKNNINKINFKNFINNFIDNKILNPETDIIITDNALFKYYIKTRCDLITLNTLIGHIGLIGHMNSNSDSDSDNDINCQIIRDTLIEFFLLKNANKIITYSIYDWVSGFVNWISKIYDIQLLSIKNKSNLNTKHNTLLDKSEIELDNIKIIKT
jgi:hypothetical protein